MAERRIVIAAGGTAGHVVPALAVADALRAKGAEVVFFGGSRAESELVPAAGYRFVQLSVEGLDRKNPLKALRALVKSVLAVASAFRLLGRIDPDAVMGGGGYVSAPVGVAAVLRHKPIILTEADSHLGLANRLLSRFARRVCLAFPIAGREGDRYLVTGRPVPRATHDRTAARKLLGIAPDAQCVLVFGGSLGARSINQAASRAFAEAPFEVIHVAGKRDYPDLSSPREGYRLYEYLDSERFQLALAACDLVVARSGGSIFEIAAAGKPAILVPYPHASADHQTINAKWMAEADAAVVVSDSELNPELLLTEVEGILGETGRLAKMSAAAAGLARVDAAELVAEQLEQAV